MTALPPATNSTVWDMIVGGESSDTWTDMRKNTNSQTQFTDNLGKKGEHFGLKQQVIMMWTNKSKN